MTEHDPWYCERSDCTDISHTCENWCEPCGGWIDGEPCDEPYDGARQRHQPGRTLNTEGRMEP